jgi:integrase
VHSAEKRGICGLYLHWSLVQFRISDVIRLRKEDFDRLELEPPIPLRIRATKEGTLYETYISQEFKEILKLYLPTLKGKWLFEESTPESHTQANTLNRILQRLDE